MGKAYPSTRVVDDIDERAGVRLANPYAWLEANSSEVRAWQRQQAERASAHVREWPCFPDVRRLLERFEDERFATVPRFAGGRWFRMLVPEGSSTAQVVMSDAPFGKGELIVDPCRIVDGDIPPFLSWISPSPNGRLLAFGVCTDGSEQNTIHLLDIDSEDLLPAPRQVLHDSWTGGAVWLADSSGFYYVALTGTVHEFDQAPFLHIVGQPPPTEPEREVPLPEGSNDYTLMQVSADGRWAVAVHRILTPIPVAVRDLSTPGAPWRPFVTEPTDTVSGYAVGNHYLALTDVDAPRGRVVAIPLDADDPNDTSCWQDIVPASDAVLRTLSVVAGLLYITEFVDTYSRVRIVDPVTRHDLGEMPLPGNGALSELPSRFATLLPKGHPDEFLFAFSTLTSSWGIYRHRPGDAAVEELAPPRVSLDDVTVVDHWATSSDGTRVPYHVVRLDSSESDGPLPALLYAYGGLNVPLPPAFTGAMAAFVAAGGVYLHVHLRGGGEFGRDWWEGGRLKHKQNCYADLYAVAEDAISRGITTPSRLALTGGSNGGLMAGVAVTQRPDLWAAVIPTVPILDLVGAIRDPYGESTVRFEFADPDDPAEIHRLAAFSPYHLVKDGTSYPPVFVDAGDTDPRCPPWHARKWVARMQAAQLGDAPILLHVWEGVGHGWATPKETALTETVEWLSFAMRHTGLSPRKVSA